MTSPVTVKAKRRMFGKCQSRQSTCKKIWYWDKGHLLVQVLKRSGILVKRIVHKELGIISRTKCCWNSQKADILFSVQRLHCPGVLSKAKEMLEMALQIPRLGGRASVAASASKSSSPSPSQSQCLYHPHPRPQKAGQVTLAGNNGPLSACFFAMCRQAAPFDLRWRVTVYNPPTGLFDWRRTAVPAGMKLDTKRVTVDEPLKFFQRHKITQYNTTTLPRSGTEWAKKHDRSSLRVLGTMEESITSETHDVVREKRCSIVDILGQTR